MAELGKLGGRARGRKKEEQPGDGLESLAHAAIEKLLTSSGSATAQASAARLVLDKLAASSPCSAELAKRAAGAEIQAQMQAELPFARARLERLVERRARERFEALTAEELDERVERRAEEKYRERMKAETEAVKAELTDPSAPSDPPARRVSLEEAMEEEHRRAERERIERELRGNG